MRFHIGIQNTANQLCEHLCTVDADPLTSLQLQKIIDILECDVVAVLPYRIAVEDIIERIQTITGGTITNETENNVCGQGVVYVIPLFICGSPKNWRYFEYGVDGRIEELAAFLCA
jgi:hypothetical protein